MAAQTVSKEKQTAEALVMKLKKKLGSYYEREGLKARVENAAIPNDPMVVHNWPRVLEYVWIPAPTGTGPINSSEGAATIRVSMIQKGWQYFPAEDMGHSIESEMPYVVGWEEDNGRVRFADMWLMYADKGVEARKRKENLDRWNNRRQARKEEVLEEGERGGRVVSTSEQGKVPVSELLKDVGE